MNRLVAAFISGCLLAFPTLSWAQVVGGTLFATSNGASSVTVNDGLTHAIFGWSVTAPVSGFVMMWPLASVPGPFTPAPVCIATPAPPAGTAAATTSNSMGVAPTVAYSFTIAFSTASDCSSYTASSTSVNLVIYYQ